MWNHADEFAPFENAHGDLQNTHQDDSREQVFDAMLSNERDHDHGKCAGRARDHARTSADTGSDQAHKERRIKANERIDACNECKGNRFRYQRECNRQTRKQFCFDA